VVFALPVTVAEKRLLFPGANFADVGDIEIATVGTTVILADADILGLAKAVAVTLKYDGLGTVPGAVYKPEGDTVPHTSPAHPKPEMLQATAVLALPVTTAVNCFCAPVVTCALVGEMEIETDEPIVTVAVAETVKSARDVAVTVTLGGVGDVIGAV
jgi:hypothetical protein